MTISLRSLRRLRSRDGRRVGGGGEMAIIDRWIRPRLGAGIGRLEGWGGDEGILLLFVHNAGGCVFSLQEMI